MADQTEIRDVTLPSGVTVHFQVASQSGGGGYEPVAGSGPLDFGGVLESIEGVASALGATLKKLSPKKASVEMGVELSTKEGKLLAVFIQGEAKANLKITLEW